MLYFLAWIAIGAVFGFALMYESTAPGDKVRLIDAFGSVLAGAVAGPATFGLWFFFRLSDFLVWLVERYGDIVLFTKKGEKPTKTGVYEENYDD